MPSLMEHEIFSQHIQLFSVPFINIKKIAFKY
jgi:hypothetical protein